MALGYQGGRFGNFEIFQQTCDFLQTFWLRKKKARWRPGFGSEWCMGRKALRRRYSKGKSSFSFSSWYMLSRVIRIEPVS